MADKKTTKGVSNGQKGTFVRTEQTRRRTTPFGRILTSTEEGTETTGISLGRNTGARDRFMMSILGSLGIDAEKAAKSRQEFGAREVIDKVTGEKTLTRKLGGVGIADYAASVVRRQGIQGTGPLKQYKTKFVPDPVPLKDGYTFHINSNGEYYYQNKDGKAVPSSEALTSDSKSKTTREKAPHAFLESKPGEKRYRIPTTAGDRFKSSLLKSLGVDLEKIGEYERERGITNKYGELIDPDAKQSRLGKLYSRTIATRVVKTAKSDSLPTLTNNTPQKVRRSKTSLKDLTQDEVKALEDRGVVRQSKMKFRKEGRDLSTEQVFAELEQTTTATPKAANKKPPVTSRRVPSTAGDRFMASIYKSLGVDIEAMHKYEMETGVVNKHGELLEGNTTRSKLGALHSRLNKWEKVGGSDVGSQAKSGIEQAVNAFKEADKNLKRGAAARATKAEASMRSAEEADIERGLQRTAPAETASSGLMSGADLLLEMLPDITKQIVELTEALRQQGENLGDEVSEAERARRKAEQEAEKPKKQSSKPKFRMSSLSPKAKTAAKVAAVVGGTTLAAYMATRGQMGQGQQQGSNGIMDMISSATGSLGQTASNLLDSASEALFGLKPAGDSAHAGQAMAYFMSQGWTKQQAAGIVGNLQQESGANLDSNAHNSIGMFGIAQWDTIRRNRYQKNSGKPIYESSFIDQLGYVNWELNNTHKNAGNALRKATDATTAAQVVQNLYEGAPGQDNNKRIVNAKFLAGEEITDSSLAGQADAALAAVSSATLGSLGASNMTGGIGGITSKFGMRNDPFGGGGENHLGVDIKANQGVPVYSASNGKVQYAKFSHGGDGHGGQGLAVQIEAAPGLFFTYGHLSAKAVNVGQSIKAGDPIGLVGSTGRSTGPHLHFEIRRGSGGWGTQVDPMSFLKDHMWIVGGDLKKEKPKPAPKPVMKPKTETWQSHAWNALNEASKAVTTLFVPVPVPAAPAKQRGPVALPSKAPVHSDTGINPGQRVRGHFGY